MDKIASLHPMYIQTHRPFYYIDSFPDTLRDSSPEFGQILNATQRANTSISTQRGGAAVYTASGSRIRLKGETCPINVARARGVMRDVTSP